MIPSDELELDPISGVAVWRRGRGALSREELGWVRAVVRDGVRGVRATAVRVELGSASAAQAAAAPLEFIGAEAWSGGERVSSGMKVTRREDFGI